jgi:chromosome segregation ATPase
MRERSEMDNLRVDIERLKERVEGIDAAQEDLYRRIDGLRSAADADRQDLAQRLAALERDLKVLDAAREKDRQAIIDSLSNKITGIIQSQAPPARRGERGYEHVVQQGQTLSEIAAVYNVKVDAIVEANNLADPNSIRVGRTLFIPE